MATDMDRAFCEWPHEDMHSRSDSEEASISQIIDNGSISFGRFSVESLSWEKWSVFSHNKFQEELEKFKTPGLVAQKKAYFEAHYKRVRALKALQDQQTETALDPSGNGSVYRQASEEEKILQVEDSICQTGVINQSNLHEENVIEVSIEPETNSSDGIQNLELKSPKCFLESSRRNICDERTVGIEEQNSDCKNFTIEGIPLNDGCSIATAKAVSAAQETAPEQMASTKKRDLNDTQKHGLAPNNIELNIKRCKDFTSIPKAQVATSVSNSQRTDLNPLNKDPIAASNKDNVKVGSRTKADVVKSSQLLKYPLRKATGKAERSISSNKPTSNVVSQNSRSASNSNSSRVATCRVSDTCSSSKETSMKVLGSNGSAPISSHGLLTEVRSSITIPRPFPLSTEKRSAASANTRDVVHGQSGSKASNRLAGISVYTRSLPFTKSTSMDMSVTGSVGSTASAKRRNQEVLRKSAIDGQSMMRKGKDVDDCRLKFLSTLVPKCKSNQNGRNDINLSVRSNGKKEVKAESSIKQSRQSSKIRASSPSSLSRTGIPKPDHKKIIQSCSVDLRNDGQKPKGATPCWR